MKKVLLTVVVIALTVTSVFAFAGCVNWDEMQIPEIGKTNPEEIAAINIDELDAIDETMSPIEMFVTAIENYNKVNYSASRQVGMVTTSMPGIKVKQQVDAARIKRENDTYMYNNSFTSEASIPGLDIRVMEQYFVKDGVGNTKFRSCNGKGNCEIIQTEEAVNIYAKPGKWESKNFVTFTDYTKDYPNDPTRMFMYEINEETYNADYKAQEGENTTPQLKDGYYEFTIDFNAADAFVQYIEVMNYMLESSGTNGNVKDDKPMTLRFNIQIWECGLIKQYKVTEEYEIKALGLFNGSVSLISDVRFTYDQEELDIATYLDANNNFIDEEIPKK